MIRITCTCAGGRPVSELAAAVRNRMRILGEDAQDAAVATAITAMSSLRALTRKAKVGAVKVSRASGYVPGWKGRRPARRVIRAGGGTIENAKRTRFAPGTPFFVISGRHPKNEKLKAFWWHPPVRERAGARFNSPVLIAATSSSEARKKGKRLQKRRLEYGKMAKRAWGKLMRMTSTRNPPALEQVSARAVRTLDTVCRVGASGGPGDYTLAVRDGLDYAALALKGGPSSVNLALKKAANKISGRLSRVYKSHADKFMRAGVAMPRTPFPEIASGGRRVSA